MQYFWRMPEVKRNTGGLDTIVWIGFHQQILRVHLNLPLMIIFRLNPIIYCHSLRGAKGKNIYCIKPNTQNLFFLSFYQWACADETTKCQSYFLLSIIYTMPPYANSFPMHDDSHTSLLIPWRTKSFSNPDRIIITYYPIIYIPYAYPQWAEDVPHHPY